MYTWFVVSIILGFSANIVISAPLECEGPDCSSPRTCEPLAFSSLAINCFSPRGQRLTCDERMRPGAKANLGCREGFWLDDPGYSQITCEDDGVWDTCPFACQRTCGYQNPQTNDTDRGLFPWHVSIFRTDQSGESQWVSCEGTIIGDNMILTVASCLFIEKAKTKVLGFKVAVGTGFAKQNGKKTEFSQFYDVERIVLHPQYLSVSNYIADIAIILTIGKIEFNAYIAPVCIDLEFGGSITELPIGTNLTVSGYKGNSATLQAVNLPALPLYECKEKGPEYIQKFLTDKTLCAGDAKMGMRIIGKPYLGSGALFERETSYGPIMYIRGILSVGADEIGIVALTDIFHYLDWIRDMKKFAAENFNVERPQFCARTVAASYTRNAKCTLPSLPENGEYTIGGFLWPPSPGSLVPEYSVLKYSCDDGYGLTSSNTRVCEDGRFPTPPSCLKKCESLTSDSVQLECFYEGKTFSCDEPVKFGTIAKLQCKRGYKLNYKPDLEHVTCGKDGAWDYSLYKCDIECGLARPKGTPYVVNGKEVDFHDFPWHVGIFKKVENGDYIIWCGGSIISSKLLLSAAHCFYPADELILFDKSQFGVAVGKIYADWKHSKDTMAQYRELKNIIVHRGYYGREGNYAGDIALLELELSLEFSAVVRPVCIDWNFVGQEKEFEAGTQGIVAGWGLTIEGGETSPYLRYAVLPTVPHRKCLEDTPRDFRGLVTLDKFCAGYLNGTSLCKGDSGGGLAFPTDNGERPVYYLRGIVSVGPTKDSSCDSHQYTVFTSVLSHLNWLKDNRK